MTVFEELDDFQEVIGVSDEEVAARVRKSTQTYRRAKRGNAPVNTVMEFRGALESIRLERIEKLQKLKFRTSA